MAKIVTIKYVCDKCRVSVGKEAELLFKKNGRELTLHFCYECSRNLLWTQLEKSGDQRRQFLDYYEERGTRHE
jgi:hypothetical protein